MREQLLAYAIKYDGNSKKIKKAIELNEKWEKVACSYPFICILDDEYPKQFLQLEEIPYVLFYQGNISLLKHSMISVIGSRNCSDAGRFLCRHAVEQLNEKYVIVSGLAKGIDGMAHQSAIASGRKTIGVIGCGIDVCYPKENMDLYEVMKAKHLIISEYPPHVKPYAANFPCRNRLIAALSEKLIVIEAKWRSGTMITVNAALSLNRDVYVMPYRFDQSEGRGCNQLILEGANILVCDDDLRAL